MFENREHIRDSFAHRRFFQAVEETTVRADRSRPVDISLILQYFRNLGSNDTMALMDLTTKLCWLLGVCGFLRPSDIERIDLRECDWTSQTDRLSLLIIDPKEKRLGQRIQKSVQIRAHPDPLLCPVAAFRTYYQRHALCPCLHPHPALSHVQLHYLIRDVRNCHRPIYAQRIGNLINSIMTKLPASRRSGRLKARALGSSRALLAGASVDDVVTHGGWASRSIFNTFYRLSVESSSNFTSLALSEQDSSVALESQSMDPLNEV
jgi:hypothetical protein